MIRVINLSPTPVTRNWSLNLLPAEMRAEFETHRTTDDFKGLTPEQRKINKRTPLSTRLEEWVNMQYQKGARLPYGEMVTKQDAATKAVSFSYHFVLPSSIKAEKYLTTQQDAMLPPADAVRLLAARLGVEPMELKLWNKSKALAPILAGQELVYYVIDRTKAAVLSPEAAQEFAALERKRLPQEMTREEIKSGVEQYYYSGFIIFEDATELVEDTAPEEPEAEAQPDQTNGLEKAEEDLRSKLEAAEYKDVVEIAKQKGIVSPRSYKRDALIEKIIEAA